MRYLALRRIARFRERVEAAEQGGTSLAQQQQVLAGLQAYARRMEHRGDEQLASQATAYRKQVDGERNVRHCCEVMDATLLRELDTRARHMTEQEALVIAAATALLPRFETPFLFWRLIRTAERLGRHYGGRPGLPGTLRLLRRAAFQVFIIEAVDQLTVAVLDAVGGKFARLGSVGRRSLINAVLYCRISEQMRRECRPLPVHGNGPGLVAIVQKLGGRIFDHLTRRPAPT